MSHTEQPFQPYDTLNNRTFHGLLVAEFLAAFNDQCIHAAAMFFAIHKGTLTEGQAIALMPLLFYSPWALFAPLSGYLADRYSKRTSLIFWKVAEVGITGLATVGFFIGSHFTDETRHIGAWMVMACVFLMGLHSTFYVPNKYGVLPEIFTVRKLSRANGLIESTTFLAIILGTTAGGLLSGIFEKDEVWIGVILLVLALIGTLTSYMIQRMPPADPERPFPGWAPWQLFQPLFKNLGILLTRRLTTVAVLGLSFFTFLVAFLRATMYMFGEVQNPPWSELQISLMVAVVSLGVGFGSPLAGYLSGGKVELGLVPLGALGIVLGLMLASVFIGSLTALILCLVALGLFASFYLVPLYSLLQYSAPKGSKGMSVATNNFIATSGAILASLVFFAVVQAAKLTGISEPVHSKDIRQATLLDRKGKQQRFPDAIRLEEKNKTLYYEVKRGAYERASDEEYRDEPTRKIIELADTVRDGSDVIVSTYKIRDTRYFDVRPAGTPLVPVYNEELLPRYLFMTAGFLMLCIFLVLCGRLPDLPLRTVLWLRSVGRIAFSMTGYDQLPQAPAVLDSSCRSFHDAVSVMGGIVRPIRLLLIDPEPSPSQPVLWLLARLAGSMFYTSGPGASLDAIVARAQQSLAQGYIILLAGAMDAETRARLLTGLTLETAVPIVPVACDVSEDKGRRHIAIAVGVQDDKVTR